MSDEQAQCEAVRRWGPLGRARKEFHKPGVDPVYIVGRAGEDFDQYGKGCSWEAAFADATKNGH